MSYKVLARKWRPQRFEDVIGQRGVTQTLRNAIGTNRIAQSFVFAGPRGVGKTTTARILARGLSCVNGPTADPCGVCEPCVEIAEGRDMDVLEMDAATHTQVDKVRDIIIAGLGMAPARNRYKIFIIDEVHRLSPQAFDALLKSIEEPPPHVVFMMATTELEKVPATIQSRSQLFELKTIGVKPIADQLRRIADAEGIAIDDAALMLIARAGEGSMRDAQSAFDQVIAFAGDRIAADDVATVLGLVRRDLLLDLAEAVAAEDGSAAFELAGNAVESGCDLRLVVRELARLTRDMLVVKLDRSRIDDPEVAADAERERLGALAERFSAEDLMRAFEVLNKAEYDIRGAAYPRFHLEMALLRWIHLRKLVPLSDLIDGLGAGGPGNRGPGGSGSRGPGVGSRGAGGSGGQGVAAPASRGVILRETPESLTTSAPRPAEPRRTTSGGETLPDVKPVSGGELKETFLNEIRKAKKFFHGSVVSTAQRIEIDGDRVVFTFAPIHRVLRGQLDQQKPWLETLASQLGGRKMTVVSAEGTAAAPAPAAKGGQSAAPASGATDRQTELKQQAMADPGVQSMLDVFGTEIKEVEEM